MEMASAESRLGLQAVEAFVYPASPWSQGEAGDRIGEVFPSARAGEAHPQNGSAAGQAPAAANKDAAPEPPEPAASLRSEEEWAARLAEEVRRAEERGRARGIEAGLAMGRDEVQRQWESERGRLVSQAATLSQSFAQSQAEYFDRVEAESVRLALAIAARILRREAQMDPLLLTGAVRVALGQLSASTAVRLRVPARDRELWEESLALIPGLKLRPEVVADGGMNLGECRMETAIGSADLSLLAQLKEIERGFFDRVGERGGAAEGSRIPADPTPAETHP